MTHFTHLHVHSHYTLLGSTASVEQLVATAVSQNFSSLALTDTAVLYGAVQFSQACQKTDIQPIIGMSIPLASPSEITAIDDFGAGKLLLLAKNFTGYQSLCRISSFIQGSATRSALLQNGVDWDLLKANREGVICIEGGRVGWLMRALRQQDQKTAVRYASRLAGIFGEDAYLSLEIHQPTDANIAHEVVRVGDRFGLGAVAVQPVYCLQAQDAATLRLLKAIDHNCLLEAVQDEDLPAFGDPAATLHWQSPSEVKERFAQFPQAIKQVGQIVSQCEPCLPDGRPIWPKLELPKGQTVDALLAERVFAGLQLTGDGTRNTAYKMRLYKELKAIEIAGYAPLFLLVADITRFARETAVPVNTRGSVANSLVAYCLGITTVDPIEHDLLFERFLNPARANLPDIDLDFCSRRRDEVLHYVRQKYGEDKVALVATMSTMQPKSAVRETAKAYGYDSAQIKKLSSKVPRHWHPDPRRREGVELESLLAELDDPQDKTILETAFGLMGQPHHLSIHPGGIVITPNDLTEFVPLQMAPKGFLTTQYDYRDVETIGLPKMDLLGIRALTVLADTAESIRQQDSSFDLHSLPLNDAETAVTLTLAQTIGVFQCESTGAQRTLRQLKAKNVSDLAVANAFFKPGPALGGMAQAFIHRYRGDEKVNYLHPALEPILQGTYGVLIFQEQILRIATEVSNLSWAEADRLRKGMSKFQAKEMQMMRMRFIQGCQDKSGLTAAQAETLWEQVEPFSGYGFNKGHATAYADISYRSAYLKTHYPAQFLCARLADHGGFHHPAIYIAEAHRLGFAVLPPHINVSKRKFTLAEKDGVPALYMGLGQVRDLRRSVAKEIIAKRPFSSLRSLLQQVTLQKKEVLHLIQCGALDGLGESRAALLAEAEGVARAGSALQMAFGFAQNTAVAAEGLTERLVWETHILGWPVSANPLQTVSDQTKDDVPIHLVHRLRNQKTSIAGVRLPGWTGGQGFYFGDGQDFVVAKTPKNFPKKIPLWEPVRLTGLWREDEWGSGWFEVHQIINLQTIA